MKNQIASVIARSDRETNQNAQIINTGTLDIRHQYMYDVTRLMFGKPKRGLKPGGVLPKSPEPRQDNNYSVLKFRFIDILYQ
ncbi:hypothetical protein [Calothrix sp. NIES-3974]|uniref:hypothetical protein n=1 Tax=Calothrix sp. NIES-3974 TaxID=2005462 RepID=UPI000BBC36ED|nr:hypothetical protein [Calothrix sp. NIES-3974]